MMVSVSTALVGLSSSPAFAFLHQLPIMIGDCISLDCEICTFVSSGLVLDPSHAPKNTLEFQHFFYCDPQPI